MVKANPSDPSFSEDTQKKQSHSQKKMSSFISSLPKFSHVGAAIAKRNTRNPMLFVAATPRYIQVSSSQEASGAAAAATEAVKEGATHAQQTAENMKDTASSNAQRVSEKTKDMAGKLTETAQDVTDKGKQTMQEAWGSTKDTAQKASDTVKSKTEQSKQHVQANAEKVKKCMNTKGV